MHAARNDITRRIRYRPRTLLSYAIDREHFHCTLWTMVTLTYDIDHTRLHDIYQSEVHCPEISLLPETRI